MSDGAADAQARGWGAAAGKNTGGSPRLIPAVPSYANVSERRFAEALHRQLPDQVVVFANQRFTDREGDREADLIVMWPNHGIAVIEVKGGLIHLLDGQWR